MKIETKELIIEKSDDGRHFKFEVYLSDTVYFAWTERNCICGCCEDDYCSTHSIKISELFDFLNNKKKFEKEIEARLAKEVEARFSKQLAAFKTLKTVSANKDAKIFRLESDIESLKKTIKVMR